MTDDMLDPADPPNDKTWCPDHGMYRATCVEAGKHPAASSPAPAGPFPVTDPAMDAPDGARMMFERVRGAWEPVDSPAPAGLDDHEIAHVARMYIATLDEPGPPDDGPGDNYYATGATSDEWLDRLREVVIRAATRPAEPKNPIIANLDAWDEFESTRPAEDAGEAAEGNPRDPYWDSEK